MTILAHGTEFSRTHQASPEKVARKVEGLFMQMLVRELRRSLPQGGMLSGGLAGQMFTGLFDRAIADQANGSLDMGLAAQLCAQIGVGPPSPPPPAADWATEAKASSSISSGFGPRSDPFTGEPRFHHGVDVAAPVGTPIQSPAEGTVVHAGTLGNYGNTVRLRTPEGALVTFAHCDRVLVRPGQWVGAGERVATVGKSGRSTGPHLHLEVKSGGRTVDPVRLWGRQKVQESVGGADVSGGVSHKTTPWR